MDELEVIKVWSGNQSFAETGRKFNVSRQRIHQIIRNYYNWGKQGRLKKYKKRVFGKKCQVCNYNPATILHHKDFNNLNDYLQNLMGVCKDCHIKTHSDHRRKIKYYAGKFDHCVNCGVKFTYDNRHFHKGFCKKCHHLLNKLKVESFYCNGCGELVDKRIESNRRLLSYCQSCNEIWSVFKRDPKTFFICSNCGIKFHPLRNWKSLKIRKQKFCSFKCYRKYGIGKRVDLSHLLGA